MINEAVGADEIIARFKAMRTEQARLKRRQFRINLSLARIYTLLFFVQMIGAAAQVFFDILDFFKKFVGHSNAPKRQFRTSDLRPVIRSSKASERT